MRNRGTSKTSIPQTHKTQKTSQKPLKTPLPKFPITGADKPRAHVGKQHATPVLNKGQEETCCLIQRERNVDPFLFPTRIRTMKKLVLTSAIHDKYVTMAETAQVSFIIRTGPTPSSEDCGATKTHRNDELGFTELSKQKFVIAMPPNTRIPSLVKVQVRGGRLFPPHHTKASLGVRWPSTHLQAMASTAVQCVDL